MTKAILKTENERLTRENTVLMRGIQALMNKQVDWLPAFREPLGGRYRIGVQVGRCQTLLFIVYVRKGQNDHVAVYDLDEYYYGPWKVGRDGLSEWYKLAHPAIEEAWRTHVKGESVALKTESEV